MAQVVPDWQIHPGALLGLAHVLQSGFPKMTADQAVDNAVQIIRGLHMQDLEIGPLAAFGPHEVTVRCDHVKVARPDPFAALDPDEIEREWGRKPWLP